MPVVTFALLLSYPHCLFFSRLNNTGVLKAPYSFLSSSLHHVQACLTSDISTSRSIDIKTNLSLGIGYLNLPLMNLLLYSKPPRHRQNKVQRTPHNYTQS